MVEGKGKEDEGGRAPEGKAKAESNSRASRACRSVEHVSDDWASEVRMEKEEMGGVKKGGRGYPSLNSSTDSQLRTFQ